MAFGDIRDHVTERFLWSNKSMVAETSVVLVMDKKLYSMVGSLKADLYGTTLSHVMCLQDYDTNRFV